MGSDKLKSVLAVVLVLALAVVLWLRFGDSPRKPARPLPAVHPEALNSRPATGPMRHELAMPAQLLRNPFRPRQQLRGGTLPDYRRLYVSMIAVGKKPTDTFARINGRILHVGDSIGGFKVLGIRNSGVWVQRAGEKKHFIRIF